MSVVSYVACDGPDCPARVERKPNPVSIAFGADPDFPRGWFRVSGMRGVFCSAECAVLGKAANARATAEIAQEFREASLRGGVSGRGRIV